MKAFADSRVFLSCFIVQMMNDIIIVTWLMTSSVCQFFSWFSKLQVQMDQDEATKYRCVFVSGFIESIHDNIIWEVLVVHTQLKMEGMLKIKIVQFTVKL